MASGKRSPLLVRVDDDDLAEVERIAADWTAAGRLRDAAARELSRQDVVRAAIGDLVRREKRKRERMGQ